MHARHHPWRGLGYVTFYAPELWGQPLELLKLWNGGMSFHGGLVGVLAAITWVAWRGGLPFVRVCDYIAVCVPFGMLFGRLANFVNGELWGRVASPGQLGDGVSRRRPAAAPPQPALRGGDRRGAAGRAAAAAVLEDPPRFRPGMLVGLFTLGFGAGRFTAEYFREPDAQLAEFALRTGLSMGQWLTLPLMAAGLYFAVRGHAPAAGLGARPPRHDRRAAAAEPWPRSSGG